MSGVENVMRLILIVVCIVASGCAEVANFSSGDNTTMTATVPPNTTALILDTVNQNTPLFDQTTRGTQGITVSISPNITAFALDQSTGVTQSMTVLISPTISDQQANGTQTTISDQQANGTVTALLSPAITASIAAQTTSENVIITPSITASSLEQQTNGSQIVTSYQTTGDVKPVTALLSPAITASVPAQTTSEIKPVPVIITPSITDQTVTALISPTILYQITTGIQSISTPYVPSTIKQTRDSTAFNNLFRSAGDVRTTLPSKSWQATNWDVPNATAEQDTISASTAHRIWHDKQGEQQKSSYYWLVFFCGLVVCMCVFAFFAIVVQMIFDSSSEYQVVYSL